MSISGGCVVVGGQTEVEDGGVGADHVAGGDRISYVGQRLGCCSLQHQ